MSAWWNCKAIIAPALLLAVGGCAGSPGPEAATRASDVLTARTAAALGAPTARAEASALVAELSGTSYPTEQSHDPALAIGEAERFYRWRFDQDDGRLIRDAEQRFPGGIRFWTRIALTPAGGWSVDLDRWRTGDDLLAIDASAALQSRLNWERFFPHLLLAQASGSEVSVRGPLGFHFADASGAGVEVTVDPETLLPTKAAAQPANGAPPSEYRYLDYERRHGVLMPGRVQIFAGGRLQEEVRLGATSLADISEADLSPPAGYFPPPRQGDPYAEEISPGVFFFEDMPGGYHAMAVDVGDHLILIEAPLSPAYAELQRAILERLRPGKSVQYVLVTHHHGDHTGGLATWATLGATILVADGAAVAVERQLRARGFTGDPIIEEVSGRRAFGDASNIVHAYAVASDHSAANLIIHLPGSRLLFQGDFFYVPERGEVPQPFPVATELRRFIDTAGLDVERIAGVHGRIATATEFDALAPRP